MSPRAATLYPAPGVGVEGDNWTLPVSRTPRPGSVVWVPWTCGLNPVVSAMNGRIAPRVWGPAGGMVVLPAIFSGVPAPNWSSVRRTFCSSASPRGRNASLVRRFLADDRAPRLPNSIGDSLLPSLIPRAPREIAVQPDRGECSLEGPYEALKERLPKPAGSARRRRPEHPFTSATSDRK